MLWASKSGISLIHSLIRSILYLSMRRSPWTDVVSNTSPLRVGPGWRRIRPALQDVGSTTRLTSWRCLTAAARGFLAGATARKQLAPRRARR